MAHPPHTPHHDHSGTGRDRNRSGQPRSRPSPGRATSPPRPTPRPDHGSASAAKSGPCPRPTHGRSPTRRAHPTRRTYALFSLRPPATVALPDSRKPARQSTTICERGLSLLIPTCSIPIGVLVCSHDLQVSVGIARLIPGAPRGLTPRRPAARSTPSAGVAQERSALPKVGLPSAPHTEFLSAKEE